jgi:carbapenam-3-carboxylate synthase
VGFLLRCGTDGPGLGADAHQALTTVHRRDHTGVQIVHGDLLDAAFPLPPPGAADRLRADAGRAFARHCGAVVDGPTAVLWSDHGGLCPLQYAYDRAGDLMVATSAAALLPPRDRPVRLEHGPRRPGRTGFVGVAAVPAGAVVSVPVRGPGRVETTSHFRLPTAQPMSAERAVHRVGEALDAAVAQLLHRRDTAGVLLSGGVDSSTVAALARARLPRLRSYTIGTTYSDEFKAARRVARLLGTDHAELLLTPADLSQLLPRMIRLLETWQLDTLRIAAPICFALDQLRGREMVLLTGYGADLLFAGLGGTGAAVAIERHIRAAVTATGSSNEFSPAVAEDDRILVRHPYWTAQMISTALEVPAGWKLHDGAVKWVLRQAAARLLPADVAHREKIAIQDGTAMHRLFADVLGTPDSQAQVARLRQIAAEVFGAAPQRQEEDPHAHIASVAS